MILEIRNQYVSINIQKTKLLPKMTRSYIFSKIITFETLSAMLNCQNSIGNLSFLTVFGKLKSD